jgi:hypothetical protein
MLPSLLLVAGHRHHQVPCHRRRNAPTAAVTGEARAGLTRGHLKAKEKRREIVDEDRSTRRKHPQVEKKEDTVGSVTVINGAMSSTLMG